MHQFLIYFFSSEVNFRQFVDNQGLADVWQTLGVIAISASHYPQAIDYFTESLAMNKKLRNTDRELRVRNAIMEVAALSDDDNAAMRLNELARLD